MSSPFVGEIRMFGGNFAPSGWAFCSGQLMPISENATLFQLIGTTYGGDGQQTFGLPNLMGRAPMHQGNNHVLGQLSGSETVTVVSAQMPAHTHTLQSAPGGPTSTDPTGRYIVRGGAMFMPFAASETLLPMAPTAISQAGGSQPHNNMQPFLVVSFIISLFGVFPTQG